MTRQGKFIYKILSGRADTNISFEHLRQLLKQLGFEERIRGGHFIYSRHDIEEIINIQPTGMKAKPYQIKQVRNLIHKYRLGAEDDE